MDRKISLRRALADDPDPMRAPPDWANSELGTLNGSVVLHAGHGTLEGRWHSQDSDEFLLVLDGERHRTAVPGSCTLLSVEGVAMNRIEG